MNKLIIKLYGYLKNLTECVGSLDAKVFVIVRYNYAIEKEVNMKLYHYIMRAIHWTPDRRSPRYIYHDIKLKGL